MVQYYFFKGFYLKKKKGFYLSWEDGKISTKCPYIVSVQRREFSVSATIYPVLSTNKYTDSV